MKLTEDQAKLLIETPKNKELIKASRKYADELNMHITGKDAATYLLQVKSYENEQQKKLREQYVRSNKDLYSRLLRSMDKIYHSRGGAKYYNLPTSEQSKFNKILSKVRDNQTLTTWLEKNWKRKRLTDPAGVILAEISSDGLDCYPTYKSIFSIRDYVFSGNMIEYIIFEPEKNEELKEEYYRVIDDEFDRIFAVQNGDFKNAKVIDQLTNFFGYVPGYLISPDTDENDGKPLSWIDETLELAKEFMEDNSVKIIFKRAHGYPAYWELARECPKCHGTKKYHGVDCDACDGTGERSYKDVSDVVKVYVDAEGKANQVPPMGYVNTDVTTWTQMNVEIDLLEMLMHKTTWGTLALLQIEQYKTATGVVNDLQPINNRLNPLSTEAEKVEQFFTDVLGSFYFSNYGGSTIIYGKRYQLESPDQLMVKFTTAKAGHFPEQALQNIYTEYLQAEYSSDSLEMSKQLKKFRIDFHPLYDTKEIKDLELDPKILYKKLFTNEWFQTLSQEQILFTKESELIAQRDEYIQEQLSKTKIQENENVQRSGDKSPNTQR
jgi:hypothetical protein